MGKSAVRERGSQHSAWIRAAPAAETTRARQARPAVREMMGDSSAAARTARAAGTGLAILTRSAALAGPVRSVWIRLQPAAVDTSAVGARPAAADSCAVGATRPAV